MNVIMWLTIGVIVGRVASLFIGRREGIILDIIVGIVGAVVAGLVMTLLLGISPINPNPFNFPAVLVSFGGAVILLAVLNLFRQRGYRLR
jgi:uncharacterized membrane protein YeaQ/YmgE (transglycosylase-associated protein family)